MEDQQNMRKVMEEHEEQNEIDKEDQKDMKKDMVEHEEQKVIDQEDQKQMKKAHLPPRNKATQYRVLTYPAHVYCFYQIFYQ